MVETTKIQDINGSKVTSIPRKYWKKLNLNKGDTLAWSLDEKTNILRLKKIDDF